MEIGRCRCCIPAVVLDIVWLVFNFKNIKNPNPERISASGFLHFKSYSKNKPYRFLKPVGFNYINKVYFNPAKLCSIVAILERASASFLRSFSMISALALATNFSFDSFTCTDFKKPLM
jgi:hypothetical protein